MYLNKLFIQLIFGLILILNNDISNHAIKNSKPILGITFRSLPLLPFQSDSPLKVIAIKIEEQKVDNKIIQYLATVRVKNISKKIISRVKIVAMSPDGKESGRNAIFSPINEMIRPQQETDIITYVEFSKILNDRIANRPDEDYTVFHIIYPIEVEFSDGVIFSDLQNYENLKNFLTRYSSTK